MKECSKKNPAAHLKNAITYILNPEKTENSSMIGGNSGYTAAEIYDTFSSTKKDYKKMDGRQGYHFIISFKPGEATVEQVYKMADKWCQEYLGEDYDYVFAVHDDQKHLHAHVIFNSVSRTTGYKYHYAKNDWEKHIQPVTDRLCEEIGLPKLEYEEWKTTGKHYAEHMAEKEKKPTKKDILLADIDAAISQAINYPDFLNRMNEMGYQVWEGFSKKKGKAFLYFKSPEMQNSRRSYSLGRGYDLRDIKDRISGKPIPGWQISEHKKINPSPRIKAVPETGTAFIRIPYMRVRQQRIIFVTSFQLGYVKRFYRAKHIYSPYVKRNASYRKDIRRVDQLAQNCGFLFEHRIRNQKELKQELNVLKKQLHQQIYADVDDPLREKEIVRLKNELRIARRIDREITKAVSPKKMHEISKNPTRISEKVKYQQRKDRNI